jgi:hypothetical protein
VLRLGPPLTLGLMALLAAAALQGCSASDSPEGPPFESRNIQHARSLLISDSDIDEIGPSTPYGTVLVWWQALQREDVDTVRRSYARPITKEEAKRQVQRFRPRFSQPLNAEVEEGQDDATVSVVVRAATRDEDAPGVVAITDFSADFRLLRRGGEWKLRAGTYRHYLHSRKARFTPGPTG